MNKVLLLVFSALFTSAVFAGDATLTWTNPTQNTDGTSIPSTGPGSLTDITAFYGLCGSALDQTLVVPSTGAGTQQTETVPGLEPGMWCFALTAKNTYSAESARTNEVFKEIQVPVPLPPTITQESVAYEYKVHPVTQVASLGRKIGVVAYGVPCYGESVVTTERGDYYRVDPKYVLITASQPKTEPVIRCGSNG